MTPRRSLVPAPPPARRRRPGSVALVLGILASAGFAAPAPPDTLASSAAPSDTLANPAAPSDTLASPAGSLATPEAAIPAAHPSPLGVRPDHLTHASLALAIGVGIGVSVREPAAGAGAAVTLAVAKELLDDRFDRGDLAAGALGAGLAWLIVAALGR